jgi:hypothetical protein
MRATDSREDCLRTGGWFPPKLFSRIAKVNFRNWPAMKIMSGEIRRAGRDAPLPTFANGDLKI